LPSPSLTLTAADLPSWRDDDGMAATPLADTVWTSALVRATGVLADNRHAYCGVLRSIAAAAHELVFARDACCAFFLLPFANAPLTSLAVAGLRRWVSLLRFGQRRVLYLPRRLLPPCITCIAVLSVPSTWHCTADSTLRCTHRPHRAMHRFVHPAARLACARYVTRLLPSCRTRHSLRAGLRAVAACLRC